jgi:preprotein translocase subunit SecE
MARDRQRAKARKQRRAQHPAPRPSEPHRANVPGELEHASGEVDEFDAALVAGAGGEPADPNADAEAAFGEVDEAIDDEELGAGAGDVATRGGHVGETSGRTGNRLIGFLRASWAELQRVQWPDRQQVAQATAVVLGFVVIAGAYLGLADAVAKKIVDFIL